MSSWCWKPTPNSSSSRLLLLILPPLSLKLAWPIGYLGTHPADLWPMTFDLSSTWLGVSKMAPCSLYGCTVSAQSLFDQCKLLHFIGKRLPFWKHSCFFACYFVFLCSCIKCEGRSVKQNQCEILPELISFKKKNTLFLYIFCKCAKKKKNLF